jgi:hypothetical protein
MLKTNFLLVKCVKQAVHEWCRTHSCNMTSVVKPRTASLLSLRSRGRTFRPVVPLSTLASASTTPPAAAAAIAAIAADDSLPPPVAAGDSATAEENAYEDLKSPVDAEAPAQTPVPITRIPVKELLAVRGKYHVPPADFPLDLPCLAADSASAVPKQKKEHKSESKQRDKSPAPLPQSDSAWKRTGASGVEKLLRTLTGILNRLTVDNFDSLCSKFVAAVKAECKNFEILKQIVHLVHDNALAEMNFGDLYPRLCEVLSAELPTFEREIPNAGALAVEKVSFKRVMLEQCQAEFEKQIVLARELDEALVEVENVGEEDLELRLKQKDRMIGSMKFVGELYVRGMMAVKVITICILQFLRDLETPSVTNMELLCTLFSTCGKKLEVDPELKYTMKLKTNPMKLWFSQLQTIVNTADLPTRNRFQIIDLIDLRRNAWVPRRHVEKAQKIADIHDGTAEVRRLNASVSGAARFLVPQKDSRSKKARISDKPRKTGDRYSNFRKVKKVTSRQKYVPKPPSAEELNYTSGGERDEKDGDNIEDYAAENFEVSGEIEGNIRSFIEEFIEARDLNEATHCLNDVKVPDMVKNVNTVYQIFYIGIEALEVKSRQALCLLLTGFLKKKIITAKQFSIGLSHLFDILTDLAIDLPSAPKNLAEMLKFSIAESGGILQAAHVAEAREITQIGKTKDVDSVVAAVSK